MATRPTATASRVVGVAAALLAGASLVGALTVEPGAADRTAAPAAAPPSRPLDLDQAELTGTVRRIVGTQVAGPMLPLPVTLEVARGGGTKATFTGGSVGGRQQAVSWDGGRPLSLSGEGGIDLAGPADVDVTASGARWTLDGGPRTLLPGRYRFGAPVAVGSGGIATPRDAVALDVPAPGATVSTRGRVTVLTPAAPVTMLAGPGSLVVEGDLRVRTPAGTTPATTVRFGPGAFELTLTQQPGGDGWAIERSLLQGEVAVDA